MSGISFFQYLPGIATTCKFLAPCAVAFGVHRYLTSVISAEKDLLCRDTDNYTFGRLWEAFKETPQRMQSSSVTIAVFDKFVDQGYGFEPASRVAANALKSKDPSTSKAARELFESLIHKGQGYNAAIDAATEGFKSTNDGHIRVNSDFLFEALFKKGKGGEGSLDAATEVLRSTNPDPEIEEWIHESASDLLRTLIRKGGERVDKGEAFEKGFSNAIEALKSMDPEIHQSGRNFFRKFFTTEPLYLLIARSVPPRLFTSERPLA